MGADFIVGFCPIEVDKRRAKQKVREINPDTLLYKLEHYLCREFDDTDEGTAYQNAVSWVQDMVDCVYGYLDDSSREVAVLRYRGQVFVVTGGMSWGDSPTDAYEPVNVVSELGLTVEESDKQEGGN